MSAPLIALVLAGVAGPLVVLALRRWAVVDVPNARSSHEHVTPRGGGLAPALAASIAISVGRDVASTGQVALAACPLAFAMLGLADDVLPARATHRFAGQLLIAAATAWLALDGNDGARVAASIVAVVWILAVVNAWNFMDGINGIVGVTGVVVGGSWFVLGDRLGALSVSTAGAVLAAVSVAFLPLNFPRARVFLGDVGSYFFGAWCAIVVVLGLRAGIAPVAMMAPLAPFLADTGLTLLRRLLRREPVHEAHREHAYQVLVDEHGWSHTRTTAVVGVATAACGAIGVAVADRSATHQGVGFVAIALVAATLATVPKISRPGPLPRRRRVPRR